MMSMWHLKHCDVLAGLPPESLRRLENVSVLRRFAKRSHVYAPSENGIVVLVLLEGRIKIKSLTPEGKETILSFIEPGEVFGESALFGEEQRIDEIAEAVLPSLVVAIPRDPFLDEIAKSPEAALRLTKLVGLRRIRIENRVKGLLFRNSRDRVLLVLNELAGQYGTPNGAGREISIKLSHQDLASLAGVTRETVTLTLGELQFERLITVKKKSITLLPDAATTNGQANYGTKGSVA